MPESGSSAQFLHIRMTEPASMLTATIPPEAAGRRFDQALADLFPDFSRSRLTVWIKRRSEGRGRTVRGFFITRTENARLPSQREVA